ncbi:hypothetical protein GBF38_016593 [Nibea albiflora]|uniref:Uncharacterized protein n=1 Tax=Nibea albiflora TaxID=240163 RepID=A0ACB7ERR1_NIBAL|nr:hypothetical protein GBF38_016593 [Nibea albiflora]
MLNEACKMGLKLWHDFLSSWHGISFFYDDHTTKPENVQSLTDAAPSVDSDGYCGSRCIWRPAAGPRRTFKLGPLSNSERETVSKQPVSKVRVSQHSGWNDHNPIELLPPTSSLLAKLSSANVLSVI